MQINRHWPLCQFFAVVLSMLMNSALSAAPNLSKLDIEKLKQQAKTAQEISGEYEKKQAKLASEKEGLAPTGVTPRKDAFDDCEILVSGNDWTFIPKGSIIHLPEAHRNKIARQALGKFKMWEEFFRVNRSWLMTESVTLDQANGKVPFSEERKKVLTKLPQVSIAVFKGGPIGIFHQKKLTNLSEPQQQNKK